MTQNKTNKVSNVPPLRFPEFSGEYEKHSLGEMGNGIIGLTYSPRDVVEIGGTIVFRSSNIQNGEIDYSDLVRVNMNIRENIITRKGDLLICARNGSPKLIGKNALLTEDEAGQTFGAFMLVYRSSNNPYIHKLLNTKRYVSQVKENLGARINQITTANLNDFEFYFPTNNEESKKVADFIGLLDKRIATQIRVIDKLESLIKGIYNSILWREYKQASLSDIFIERNERTTSNNQYEVLSSTAKGLFRQADYFDKEVASANNVGYKVLRLGDVVLSPQNLWLGNINYNDIFEIGIVSPSYKVFSIRKQFNPYYVSCFLKTHRALYEYANASEQGASVVRRNLDLDAFMAITFPMPDKDIQDSVSKKLQAINKKLSVEKQILDKLKEQKNYLLSQMFI